MIAGFETIICKNREQSAQNPEDLARKCDKPRAIIPIKEE
jgi:hypothetical protein